MVLLLLVALVNLLVCDSFGHMLLAVDLGELLVEGWWAELGLLVVEVEVDAQAVKGRDGRLVEETKENLGCDEG